MAISKDRLDERIPESDKARWKSDQTELFPGCGGDGFLWSAFSPYKYSSKYKDLLYSYAKLVEWRYETFTIVCVLLRSFPHGHPRDRQDATCPNARVKLNAA